jgi:hypothetical protein
LTSSAAGLVPMKLAIVYLAGGLLGELARAASSSACSGLNLADQRLHRGLRVIQQHQAHGADDLAGSSRSGSRLTRKVPALLVSRSTRIGVAAVDHLGHQRVGHHLLDAAADELAPRRGPARAGSACSRRLIQTMRWSRSTTIMPMAVLAKVSNMLCAASFSTRSASRVSGGLGGMVVVASPAM